ncbi:MAG: alanine--tRNA ligase [candidate division Zixibacteria bacterium]|nr:alanine--tRNA ligase [candidate division Zixibacteria bacterium]
MRQSFLNFFQRYDHRLVTSSPVIPFNDPTLLFINAGMNQFKDVFTGQRKVPYSRAVSSQKCIRAGGKHNDLDNVGFTARHHTFFEMLGNFSFGDYFKEEAIVWAWEWITKELALPVDRLYASVYETDDDAFDLWGKIAPELKNGRILRFGKKDNYWSMGPTGPNGPCSEIHYDRGERFGAGPEDVVNGETERFVEIWNLVFMQFDTQPDGHTIDLPKPSVDTGAGLERIAAILQNVDSNYGIDLFQGLIKAVSDITGTKYKDNVTSHQVIADHLRALTFAIADGAGISNEGQGYVLRRILRRAARHGRLLGMEEPFIYHLVPALVDQMGNAYPEIKEKQSHIENVIRAEEESFGRTLATGLELFGQVASKMEKTGSTVVDGEEIFKLYDTHGFPYDLTEVMAAEQGFTLDREGFDSGMAQQKEQSKAGGVFSQNVDFVKHLPSSKWCRLNHNELNEPLRTVVKECSLDLKPNQQYIVLEDTPFYVEAGGQIGDTGWVYSADGEFSFDVESSVQSGEGIALMGKVKSGTIEAGQPVLAQVDTDRRWAIMRNHTSTHLTQAALRQVFGNHIKQSGSYVGPDRLRFDFSHHQPMTPEEINEVEKIVNYQILSGTLVDTEIMDIEAARATGATALFGEKYGDAVRVVSIGDFSKELCGGTHVANVSQIGPFFITMEAGIASGVRRLEAITGDVAIDYMLEAKNFRQEISRIVSRTEIEALDGVREINDSNLKLQKEIKKLKAEMFSGEGQNVGKEQAIGELTLITHDFGITDRDIMAGWIDKQKDRSEIVVAIALGEVKGKYTFMASASSKAAKKYGIHVGMISKEILPLFDGQGGGKPTFAQGSVANSTISQELFESIIAYLRKKGNAL